MAVLLLRVLVLGVIAAAAADDVPIRWWGSSHASLPCVVPDADRITPRRPPPPLESEDRAKARPYLWRRGTEDFKKTDHRVSPTGALEVVRRKDGASEGVYQCAMKTPGGLVLGYPTHLKFAYLDSQFSAIPGNMTAAAGQPVVLRCDIGSGPPAAIYWQRDSRRLPEHHRYFALENQLLILDVQKEDEGFYRCKATNTLANKTRISPAGRLLVEEPRELEVGFLSVHHEAEVAAPRGSRVILPCPVTGWPRPKIIWEVTPPGGRRSELESVEEVLVLEGVQLEDEGLYSCTVEDNSDLIKSFKVGVTEPAVLTLPPTSKQSFPASTVRFNCTVTGRPAPRLTWYKDGALLVLTGRIVVLPSVDGKRMELLIRSVTSDDAGVYQCFARGAEGAVVSAWARLNVTGVEAAAPSGVRCQPLAADRVRVRWEHAEPRTVMAYTVQINKPGGMSLPGQPIVESEEIINVEEPLMSYGFQVRAYIRSSNNKTMASDLSETVTCQGQGVPIKLLKVSDESVLVSWRQFAEGVEGGWAQWVVQARPDNSSEEHNVTLDSHVTNYTIAVPGDRPLQVRVLGTRSLPWLHQNLTLVPWTSTTTASLGIQSGVIAVPSDVEVTAVGSREFTVRWRHEEADLSPEIYTYMVCTRKVDGNEECIESSSRSAVVSGLQPASEYSVRVRGRVGGRVRARGSDFTPPVHITTQPEGAQRFKDLTYKLINATCLRVSWNSEPDEYTVHYSDELKLPINQWAAVETNGNTVLLSGLDLTRELYVMVTGYEPVGHSPIFTIPAQIRDADIQYSVSGGAVHVWWRGAGSGSGGGEDGPRVVHYSQNITQPLHAWTTRNVTQHDITITGLDLSKPTYVIVAPPGVNQRNQVITIQPQAPENYSVYLVVGVVCAVTGAGALAAAAVCVARRRKRNRSPVRSRRRNTSPSEGNEEEGSEMKALGTRLANGGGGGGGGGSGGGGGKDCRAAEPLLNGHVHITENPTSKTSNGKLRKGRRYEDPFDVSRRSVEAHPPPVGTPPASACVLLELDTSRTYPVADLTDLTNLTDLSDVTNMTDKLPDDNMNSQVRRGSAPTLQPNG